MKKITHLATAIAFLFLISGCQKAGERFIVLENKTEVDRIEEPVTLTRAELKSMLGTIPHGKIPLLVNENGDPFPSQADDFTGNGIWDELFFVFTLEAGKESRLRLKFVDPDEMPAFDARTHVQMAKRDAEGSYIDVKEARRLTPSEGRASGIYQMEGPGWENDRVGFRNYLDARNGIDIFGKTTPEMILHEAGIIGNYHEMLPWGMDILRVGTSLGAGSLALEVNGELYRVAPDARGTFEIITEGPLRSVIRFRFDNWEIGDQTYELIHDISIHAGAWFYESTVFLSDFIGEITLATGITTIDLGDNQPALSHYENGITAVSTHARQAYDFEYLGMAVMLPTESFSSTETLGPDAEDINNTILVKMPVKDQGPVNFRFYSAWEVSHPDFADEAYFNEFLELEAFIKANPLNVSAY